MTKTDLLVASAARLYSVGVDLEAARSRMDALAEAGVPYTSPEMIKAAEEFNSLCLCWHRLENEHLHLLGEIS